MLALLLVCSLLLLSTCIYSWCFFFFSLSHIGPISLCSLAEVHLFNGLSIRFGNTLSKQPTKASILMLISTWSVCSDTSICQAYSIEGTDTSLSLYIYTYLFISGDDADPCIAFHGICFGPAPHVFPSLFHSFFFALTLWQILLAFLIFFFTFCISYAN